MLEVSGIAKRFGGLTVLTDVSMEVGENAIVGLIGPNGAGKTTLFNILTGFIRPDQGSVRFRGEEVTALAPEKRTALGMARTFQVVKPFARLSVHENAMVAAFAVTSSARAAREKAAAVLDRVGLSAYRDQPASSLTLPDRKRLELARCLATEPRLLLLDEVMCGLNSTEMADMIGLIRTLRSEGLSIVLVEHIMDAVSELADSIVVLTSGQVLSRGAPEVVLRDPRVIEAYLGEDIDAPH